jgi:Ca-activated chloride channel homolog
MKASGIALLTAAQLCGVLLLSGTALAANASGIWSGLWRTPDQQGQALLDAGEPAQAAQRFQDPRRRAYADLQSGGYSGAAKLLAPFTDPQSEYNRGNALAKSGQLQAALAAYDSALKQAPADEDIRHNRDLVERALQQQQQRQQSPQSSSQNGRQGSQGNQGNQGNQGSQGSQGSQGNQGSQGDTSQGQQPQNSANGGKQGSSGSQQSGNASQQSRAGGSQSANSDQAASSESQSGANAKQQDNSSQAQREAAEAAALARAQRQRGAAGNTAPGTDDGLLAGGSQTPKQKPETERQMALDQWLRQIPDSPAGLLRRKFLIEHMIRQQDSVGSPGDAQ